MSGSPDLTMLSLSWDVDERLRDALMRLRERWEFLQQDTKQWPMDLPNRIRTSDLWIYRKRERERVWERERKSTSSSPVGQSQRSCKTDLTKEKVLNFEVKSSVIVKVKATLTPKGDYCRFLWKGRESETLLRGCTPRRVFVEGSVLKGEGSLEDWRRMDWSLGGSGERHGGEVGREMTRHVNWCKKG